MSYAAGSLKLMQGSAEVGNSSLRALSAPLNLGGQARKIAYDVNLEGVIDLAELYPAAAGVLARSHPALVRRIESVDGRAPCTLSATGTIDGTSLRPPNDYVVAIDASGIDLAINGAPRKLAPKSGQVTIKPDRIELAKLTIAAAVPDGGYAMLNGIIEPAASLPRFHGFVVDLHQIRAEQWLPLVVDPSAIAATGSVGGTLTLDSDSQPGDKPQVNGMLTMGSGQIQFGFLRSPIDTMSATLTTDGKRLKVAIPAEQNEGQSVSMVPVVSHPSPAAHYTERPAALPAARKPLRARRSLGGYRRRLLPYPRRDGFAQGRRRYAQSPYAALPDSEPHRLEGLAYRPASRPARLRCPVQDARRRFQGPRRRFLYRQSPPRRRRDGYCCARPRPPPRCGPEHVGRPGSLQHRELARKQDSPDRRESRQRE